MARDLRQAAAIVLGAAILGLAPAKAAVYVFTVSCQGGKVVEQWTADTIDPGKEALRAKTQEKHPGCAVGDYKAATDDKLLKNTQFYSAPHEAGNSGDSVPVVGSLFGGAKKAMCGLFNC
jgi:hypothetical protein